MKKYLSAIIIIILFISSFTLITACSQESKSEKQTIQLATPSGLAINNNVLSWNAVADATDYVVKVDSTEHGVLGEHSFNLSNLNLIDGTYQISVKAKGKIENDTTYNDSQYSEIIDYVLVTSVKDGIYVCISQTFNGATVGNDLYSGAAREFLRFMYISESMDYVKTEIQNMMPLGYSVNNLTNLRQVFSSIFDFTGITTVDAFWYAYIGSFLTEDDLDNFIAAMENELGDTGVYVAIEDNTFCYVAYSLTTEEEIIEHISTFTLENGKMILDEPIFETPLFSHYSVIITYNGDTITMTEELPNNNFLVSTMERL